MRFTKMHGLGNDFVMLVPAQVGEHSWSNLARQMCDRHFGIGGDGLLLVLPSAEADFRMRMFNPDGSEAEMCGNGIRCFGKFVWENHFWQATDLTVDTLAGLQRLHLNVEDGQVKTVQVNMGVPGLPPETRNPQSAIGNPVSVGGHDLLLTLVSMGNPHAVTFLDAPVAELPLETIGPLVEHHPLFPHRTNFEIVNVLGRDEIRVRVWERGAGITLACGTGTCAAAVASRLHGYTDEAMTVHLPGGDLHISWPGPGQPVSMTGPAAAVFTGDWLDS